MADTQLLKLLSSLEVQFDAAVAREEDEAASDLALSLRQGRRLRDVLRRGAWIARLNGSERPVALVGPDYVACSGPDTLLVPQRRLVVSPSPSGVEPRVSSVPIVEALRALCRSGAEIDVRCGELLVTGPVIQVGPDHLAVSVLGRPTYVALEAVDRIRLAEPWRAEDSDGL